MRRVWVREGKLTEDLMMKHGVYDFRHCRKRFGSVQRAYSLIGYRPTRNVFKGLDTCDKMNRLRSDLLVRLKDLFPSNLRVIRLPGETQRPAIEVDKALHIAVHICCPMQPTVGGRQRWLLTWHENERGLPALICTPNKSWTRITDLYLIPELGGEIKRFKVLHKGHPWLKAGKHLQSFSQFYEAAKALLDSAIPRAVTVEGDVLLVEGTATVTIAGREVTLPDVQAAIFKLLVSSAGIVVSREMLSQIAIAASGQKVERLLDPKGAFLSGHINLLPRKLGTFRKRVIAVKGKGYFYESAAKMPQNGFAHDGRL